MPPTRQLLVRTAAALVLVAGSLLSLRPLRPLPPLGPFLDPANGVWAVARAADLPALDQRTIPNLSAPVDVRYDDRGVPHIFAATREDAERALGFVVARDRLFQMELQTRATAGRLSELLGPVVLALDREQRRLGLALSADEHFAAIPRDTRGWRSLAAYADGVNAWIDQLRPADLPVEYHLLSARPMRWEPVQALYLLRRMGWTLAYSPGEFRQETVTSLVGAAAADALFPVNAPIVEPIEPGAGRYPRYDWRPLPPPARRISGRAVERTSGEAVERLSDAVGSNSWAVAPSRSASGHALLAGDPHLDLTLPSIWYEAHLVVRDSSAQPLNRSTDVYGVTIPGSPVISIGFNRDVAWSFTATEADVADFYEEQVDNPDRPTRYTVDNASRRLQERIETYRDQRGRVLATDTVYATHRGPMRRFDRRWFSMRWTVLEAEGELTALLAAAEARSVSQWLLGTRDWTTPPLTMAVADRDGAIAIRATGRFPTRRDGTRFKNGATSANDWTSSLPLSRHPFSRDPARGFVSSNNQQPLDPRADPTFLGSNWELPWRAMRLNELLREDRDVTLDDMRRWQTDPGSARADFFLPRFVQAAGLSDSAALLLAQWDRNYTKDNTRAVLFETAMNRLAALTWDELEDSTGRRVATPRDAMLAQLIQEPNSTWWDRRGTPETRETRDAIMRLALAEALQETVTRYGAPNGGGWRWDRIQQANIHHLLRIPAFSALELPVQGGRSTLSPVSGDGTQGASWRMVVDLGPEIVALGTYPGGQSGNPVSPRYSDRLARWVAGELDTLLTPRTPADLPAGRTLARLELRPDP